MSARAIPDPITLRKEIKDSHERCRQYGVNPEDKGSKTQKCLDSGELSRRLADNRQFLNIAGAQMEELYQFVAGAGFVVNITDRDGYILQMVGDPYLLKKMAAGNCSPGYRWTEKDVGTSVISLSLARGIPVQINDDEHFCRRGYGSTCSASPVFDLNGQILGIIAMSGNAKKVHPHTLGMVITAASAIENQLRIQKTSNELQLKNNYMEAIIDSIDSGVMAVNRNGIVNQVNSRGRQIFHWEASLEGKPQETFFGKQIVIEDLMQPGFEFVDREVVIRGPLKAIQLICTVRPIFDTKEKMHGTIIIFNEINRIRKLVNDMAGLLARFTFKNIIGNSSAIRETRKIAMIAAPQHSTVLLLGETGTGKELFAQAIHNHSERRNHSFIAINCGAIPRELLETELFGYAGGTFTGALKKGRPGKFELADGGTIFLDEIGDMPMDMQIKILRVLQTREVVRIGEHKPILVDVRIIAATHADLKKAVSLKNFREDLFYRLNVFPISIPPLRDRSEDILLLANYFLNRCSVVMAKQGVSFSREAEAAMESYPWPGNVRELENVIERAVNLVDNNRILPENLGLENLEPSNVRLTGSRLSELEKKVILETLEDYDFNFSKSSGVLGISRATLYNKIKKYRLPTGRQTV
ncbi:MAG: sigma 54-interacting transcriptional regulator [Proteobacteria bacterium]|nr:sigma 54-interacting transcriptional regulator [Pseudomonadota bacterium]MBU1695697.1 sigma 54-interacting transcriptional regulator [Pseudomonadota bacterium]